MPRGPRGRTRTGASSLYDSLWARLARTSVSAPTLSATADAVSSEWSDPDRHARRHELGLDLGDREAPVVEDRGAQDGVGPGGEPVEQVARLAGAARGDHRHVDRLAHGAGEPDVVAVLRPVAVHRREQD